MKNVKRKQWEAKIATNFFFNNFQSSQEQQLIENLIIEAVRIYGQDMYYIPRKLNNYDSIYGADDQSSYEIAYPIEIANMFNEKVISAIVSAITVVAAHISED